MRRRGERKFDVFGFLLARVLVALLGLEGRRLHKCASRRARACLMLALIERGEDSLELVRDVWRWAGASIPLAEVRLRR
jgi:hypothetical protein